MGDERLDDDSYVGGARAVAPIAVVIGVIAVVFGVLARQAGLDVVATVVMSATTFAGSAQFAAISVVTSAGSVVTAVATASVLVSRYALMGSVIAARVSGGPVKRFLLAQLAVDESWGIAFVRGRFSERRLIGAGVVLYFAHVGCTALGAFGSVRLGDPRAFGLDAAFPALFVILLKPHLRERDGRTAAAIGAVAALLLTPVLPPGLPVLAAAATSFVRVPVRGRL